MYEVCRHFQYGLDYLRAKAAVLLGYSKIISKNSKKRYTDEKLFFQMTSRKYF